MQRRRFVHGTAATLALASTGFAWLERWAAPASALVDPHWQRHDPASTHQVNHAPWAGFLDRYVALDPNGPNLVRYGAVDHADRTRLDTYLADLEATAVTTLARPEQLAYWLNLYNARTVAVVLDHYPIESIREVTYGRRAGAGPWQEKLIAVEGRRLSLDDGEHGIVRPIFREPRIHYAVNCAALGCPDLQPEPFRADALEAQFDRAARAFVNDARGISVTTGGAVTASSIYNWFRADFGGSEAAVLDHLRDHAATDLRQLLDGITGIARYAYDWSLNDAG